MKSYAETSKGRDGTPLLVDNLENCDFSSLMQVFYWINMWCVQNSVSNLQYFSKLIENFPQTI